jgi:hypothetical protein
MQIDWNMFSVNKLDLENPPVLIRPEQADKTKGKNVLIGNLRPEEDAKSTPSRKVVVEKTPDGEETITITIRGSTMGSHERKVEGSTLARDDRKRKPTTADQKQVVRLPASRSDRHDRSEQVTQCHGHTATRDGQASRRVGQTAPSQDRALRMVKPGSQRMEGERGEKQEACIQAHVRLPPGQVHQSRSKGSGYEATKTPGEARTPRVAEASKTRG